MIENILDHVNKWPPSIRSNRSLNHKETIHKLPFTWWEQQQQFCPENGKHEDPQVQIEMKIIIAPLRHTKKDLIHEEITCSRNKFIELFPNCQQKSCKTYSVQSRTSLDILEKALLHKMRLIKWHSITNIISHFNLASAVQIIEQMQRKG